MARTAFGRPLRSVLFDIAISVGVALFALAAVKVEPGSWRLTLIGLAMAVALLFRRTRPSASGAVVAAFAAVQTLVGWAPQVFDLAVLVAMYSVVKYADRLRDGIVAGVVVGVGAVFGARNAIDDRTAIGLFVWLVLVSGAVWLVALNTRTRRLYVQSLEERANTLERERDAQSRAAVAEERTRIARELHDVVAHSLAVMIVQADGATYMLDRDPDTARGAVKTVAETGRQALEEMRRLVGVLRDPTPAESTGAGVTGAGFTGAEAADGRRDVARTDVARIDEAARAIGGDQLRQRPALGSLGALLDRSRTAGLAVRHEVRGEWIELPTGMDLTIYRIVQESLTNALKHAGAGAAVELTLDYSNVGEVGVRVVDDGGGSVVGRPPPSGGPVPSGRHGLVGMRERVALYDGSFHAGPRLAGGWEVAVRLAIPSSGSPKKEMA